ncbi:MAG: hypothetical protein AAF533_17045 [Acidobacteriota bacterium]
MQLRTLGHASLLLTDDAGEPILLTDPWLRGSAYWRSWWLENEPDDEELETLRRVRYCYVTHEHPDHFHTYSIRRLGKGPRYLAPDLPEENICLYLKEQGFDATVLPSLEWKELAPGVSILSIPIFNDDSVLLIDTPDCFVINLNDTKPSQGQLTALRRFLDAELPGKKRLLLSSFSPASIVNSFLRKDERVALREATDYVTYISRNCDLLDADWYLPFASQVVYLRRDSRWANEFKVSAEQLQEHWCAKRTELLPTFTRLDLGSHEHSSQDRATFRHDRSVAERKVAAQEDTESGARFTAEDRDRLRSKLASARLLLAPLFPRGIGFRLDDAELRFNPWTGDLSSGTSEGHFQLIVPTAPLKDALHNGHFGDLGITMFTLIELQGRTDPRAVYVFFILLTLDDYGHLGGLRAFFRWLLPSLKRARWSLPALPAGEQAS